MNPKKIAAGSAVGLLVAGLAMAGVAASAQQSPEAKAPQVKQLPKPESTQDAGLARTLQPKGPTSAKSLPGPDEATGEDRPGKLVYQTKSLSRPSPSTGTPKDPITPEYEKPKEDR